MNKDSDSSNATTQEPSGFGHQFRARIVVVSTMERDVRLTFAFGLVALVLPMVLTLFRGHLGPFAGSLFYGIRLPAAMAVALSLLELAILYFLWLGLVLLRGRRRLFAIAALAIFALSVILRSSNPLHAWPTAAPFASLALFWFSIDRKFVSARLAPLLAIILVCETVAVGFAWVAGGVGELLGMFFTMQIIFAIFGLSMVATDIAELTSVAANFAIENVVRRQRLPVLLAALVVGTVAINFLAVWIRYHGWNVDAAGLISGGLVAFALLATAILVAIFTGRNLPTLPAHIGYRDLFVTVVVYLLAFVIGVEWCILSRTAGNFSNPRLATPCLLVGLVFLGVLFFRRKRQTHFAMCLYGVVVAFWWLCVCFLAGKPAPLQLGVGTLVLLAATATFAKLRAHFGSVAVAAAKLNLCLCAYFLLIWAATRPEANHQLNLLNVAIALVALVWDILSSGEAITNRHSEDIPRMARVSLFFAYVLTTVLQVSISATGELTGSTEKIHQLFEPEWLMATGILFFGFPFFAWVFVTDVRNAMMERADGSGLRQAPP
jgi:hypothetical protein